MFMGYQTNFGYLVSHWCVLVINITFIENNNVKVWLVLFKLSSALQLKCGWICSILAAHNVVFENVALWVLFVISVNIASKLHRE